MSSEKAASLLSFVKTVKWEDHIEDPVVQDAIEKIKDRVNSRGEKKSGGPGASKSAEVDVSAAKRVKLVVVGDGAVGKTSLLIRYATGQFPTEYVPTVFENYTAQMKKDDEVILLHLWDTAGQEDYDRLRPLSYPGADVVLLCFSTISQASYTAIQEKWAPEIQHYLPTTPHFLVGTKVDLREEKHPDPNSGRYEPILPEAGQTMAKNIEAAKYLEISSKTGKGVNELFNEAVSIVLESRGMSSTRSGAPSESKGTPVKSSKKKSGGGCILL